LTKSPASESLSIRRRFRTVSIQSCAFAEKPCPVLLVGGRETMPAQVAPVPRLTSRSVVISPIEVLASCE
jgi:hypothetical protein